jgi:hypothetical protein
MPMSTAAGAKASPPVSGIRWPDDQALLDSAQMMAGQGQVGLGPAEHEVEEQVPDVAFPGEQPGNPQVAGCRAAIAASSGIPR